MKSSDPGEEIYKCKSHGYSLVHATDNFVILIMYMSIKGRDLSVKPFSLLSTNRASLAHGGPRGGPADDERHHQNLVQEVFL